MIIVPPKIVPMGSIDAACVNDEDATIIDSYSGSGTTFANIEPNPADSSSQTANDYTATGVTFTGTAGTPSAYWALDGTADYFTFSGTITSFYDDMHKTTSGQDFTVFMTIYYVGGGNEVFWGNRSSGGTNIGVIGYSVTGNDTLYFSQRGNTATVTANSTATMNTSAYNIVGWSYDHTGGNLKTWVNSSTSQTHSLTFNTTTSAASGVPSIGAYSGGTLPMQNGSRVVDYVSFNEYFDDTRARNVIDQLNARHQRNYA